MTALTTPSICFTGSGAIVLGSEEDEEKECNPLPFLRVKKSRKFMGLQDELAVIAAGRAFESAKIPDTTPRDRIGLYMAVGYIPFIENDIKDVLDASMSDDRTQFDVKRFGSQGYSRAHPLLTFRCLPNMPAYHVSVNFDIQGAYCVAYPGAAQLYAVLEEACAALDDGRIDIALVGGVAAQSNFLVRHHFTRIEPPVSAESLRDASAMIILETRKYAEARRATIQGQLMFTRAEYTPPNLAQFAVAAREHVETLNGEPLDNAKGLGPAALPIVLASAAANQTIRHTLRSRDGVNAESEWRLLA